MRRGTVIALVALVVVLLCAFGITSACAPSTPGYAVVHHDHHTGGHSTTHSGTKPAKKATKKPTPKSTKKTLK